MTFEDDKAVGSGADEAETLDRGITPVAGSYGRVRLGRAAVVVGLGALCGLLALAPWKAKPQAEAAKAPPPRQTVAFEPAKYAPSQDVDAPELFEGEAEARLGAANMATVLATTTADEPEGRSSPKAAPGPLMVWSSSSRAEGRGRAPSLSVAEPEGASNGDGLDDGYARLRRTSPIDRADARRLRDRNFLLTAGAAIPCTLQTAMDSSLPGQVLCILGRDVWSDSGAVVLLEKGSKVLGEYRRGLMTGEGRLFVLWTRVTTPTGVAVDLASPAADALGRAGFGGDVERFFWRRFGGAVLLSVVDAAPALVLDADSSGGAVRLPSQAAAIAVDRSIDVAPVLRKPQGSLVSIMVARDLDFAQVYALRDEGGAP